MENKAALDDLFQEYGFEDFKCIKTSSIVVSHWVRMKCHFGCGGFGKSLSCPPNTPTIAECKQLFQEYQNAVLFHFENTFPKPEDRFAWSKRINNTLLKIEREVFLQGYHKAFILLMNECSLCSECATKKADCRHPDKARPIPESMGIDLFATVRGNGYPLEVLTEYSQTMNRYAILLVD